MQKAQTNLFPAFEGPEHQNLHTKGNGCVCNPFFKVEMRDEAEITHFRHQPLTAKNQANPPAWLADAEREQNTVKITNEKTLAEVVAPLTATIARTLFGDKKEDYGVLNESEIIGSDPE